MLISTIRWLLMKLVKETKFYQGFVKAMNDDFNTPEALAVLFDLAKEINRVKTTDIDKASLLASMLLKFANVLGLLTQTPDQFLQGFKSDESGAGDEVAEIEALILQRNTARANKDWASADDARDKLAALNIVLEDGANGTTWRKA